MQTNWSSAASEPRPRETVSSDKLAHVEKKYRGVAYAPSVTSKKPKRKKKHRKKGREHPDIIAKERAQAEVESEEIGDFYASSASSSLNRQSSSAIGPTAKRKRVGESTYTGSTTDGTASRQILVGSSGGRQYTVSVALPGSIVANAQSRELRTYLMGQIARSLAIFNIDEVIVYDDRSVAAEDVSGKRRPYGDPCHFMARVLQYLETPQYLRKALFPVHEDLRYAGLLNPVDAPHHMRMEERSRFREGVVLRPKRQRQGEPVDVKEQGSLVDVGLRNPIRINRKLPPNIRVTVEIDAKKSRKSKIKGHVVRPTTPRTQCGLYWGYDVRLASSLSNVWAECPYNDGNSITGDGSNNTRTGYDLVIGTSENGTVPGLAADDSLKLRPFKHLLVVFGGLSGLESVVDADERLQIPKEETASLFDLYLNTCPQQGSRTIRTEEALLITMSLLRPSIQSNA